MQEIPIDEAASLMNTQALEAARRQRASAPTLRDLRQAAAVEKLTSRTAAPISPTRQRRVTGSLTLPGLIPDGVAPA